MRQYYVYILANAARTLYTGVTSDLEGRLDNHRRKAVPGFTARYGIDRLVYYEATGDIHSALQREKQIKGWRRERKVALIEIANPEWRDISLEWLETGADSSPRQIGAQNDKGSL